jgi:hypothetical protein
LWSASASGLSSVFLASLAAAGCGASARAAAPRPTPLPDPVLVELFTSQGCSSCPAADAFVRDLPRLGFGRDRVVPLTFHVDYWDDLGWKDPFASPVFTERQRRYARTGALVTPDGADGIHGSYTPQMIVAGRVHFSGGRRDVAQAEIRRAAAAPAIAALRAEASVDGDHAIVSARLTTDASAETRKSWRLMVALAARSARTQVKHGENTGEILEEAAIVRWLSEPIVIPVTGATNAIRVTVPRAPDFDWPAVELAAFVQSTATGRVIAARAIPLPSP